MNNLTVSNSNKNLKIILTGGGTAGHIWPIVSVIDELKKSPENDVLYVGSSNGPEKEIASNAQIPFRGLLVGKWRGYFSLSNILDLGKTFIGLIQAYFLLNGFKPDLIFAKGGYVTFPVLYWAKKFHLPLVIHESDVIPGKANRWAANFAQKICVGYPTQYYKEFPIEKMSYTGTPIQKDFFIDHSKASSIPTILITGGSQGSMKINQILGQILPDLLESYEIYHLTGDKNFVDIVKQNNVTNSHYHPIGFTSDMAKIMSNSDLIVTRAGANTLAEISALKKASILIPYPGASSDHQTANANVYKENGAAQVLKEIDLTSESLLNTINRLMPDAPARNQMGVNAHKLAKLAAAQDIAKIITHLIKK